MDTIHSIMNRFGQYSLNPFLDQNRSVRVFCPNRMWSNGQFPVVVICVAIRSINCFLQINLQKTACFLQKNLQKTGYRIYNNSIWHIESLMSRTIQNGYSSSYSFHSLYLASHFSASFSSGSTPMPSAYMCANSFHARLCPLTPASRNSSNDLL